MEVNMSSSCSQNFMNNLSGIQRLELPERKLSSQEGVPTIETPGHSTESMCKMRTSESTDSGVAMFSMLNSMDDEDSSVETPSKAVFSKRRISALRKQNVLLDARRSPLHEQRSQGPQIKGSLKGKCCGECCSSRMKSEDTFSTKIKPSTRLIVTVVLICFIVALVMCGVGIGLNWNFASQNAKANLLFETELVLNAVTSFSVQQAQQRAMADQFSTAITLAEMVQHVGYDSSVQSANTMQKEVLRVSSTLVSDLYISTTMSMVNGRAKGFADTINEMCGMGLTASVVTLFNQINSNRFSQEQEVFLGVRNSDNTVTYLTNLKRCPLGSNGCVPVAGWDTVMKACLANNLTSATKLGANAIDYIGNPVFAGNARVENCPSLGNPVCVVYQLGQSKRRQDFQANVVEAINMLNPTLESSELLLYVNQSETSSDIAEISNLQNVNQCNFFSNGSCLPDNTAKAAIANVTMSAPSEISSMIVGPSYWGTRVMAAASFLTQLNLYFVIETRLSAVEDLILKFLGKAGSHINSRLNGSLEVVLGRKIIVNGTATFTFLSSVKFPNQCGTNCGKIPGTALPMVKAAVLCENGVSILTDYRDVQVIAAYRCLDDLDVGLVYKIDVSELLQVSINGLVKYINLQNAMDMTTCELMAGQNVPQLDGKGNLTTTKMMILSNMMALPYVNCWEIGGCSIPLFPPYLLQSMKNALQGQTGVEEADWDLAETKVMAAFTYVPDLAIGIVLKQSVSEIQAPIILQLLILVSTAVGVAIIGVIAEGFSARRILRQIEDTWERNKFMIETEKECFERLVAAMYPIFVTERLLKGELQIVLEIPEATALFTDICNFTAISNQITATELLEWIGYVFRILDHVAEFHKVYKVKTIGDAYFVIGGLPNMIAEGETDDHTFRVLCFAMHCIQMFSGQYHHPDINENLDASVEQNVINRRKSSYFPSRSSGVSSKRKLRLQTRRTQCTMRYGVALGPVIVGVLQGKCPAFDVWGKTVNLASRLESSGRPGNVHCSDLVYQTLSQNGACLVEWGKIHIMYAKGFGNVTACFLNSTKILPPTTLLEPLNISLSEAVTPCQLYTFETTEAEITSPSLLLQEDKK